MRCNTTEPTQLIAPHLKKRAVQPLQIHLVKVPDQGERFGSRRFFSLPFPGSEGEICPKETQQEEARTDQEGAGGAGQLKTLVQHVATVTWSSRVRISLASLRRFDEIIRGCHTFRSAAQKMGRGFNAGCDPVKRIVQVEWSACPERR